MGVYMPDKKIVRRKSENHCALADSFIVRYGLKFVLGFIVIIVFLTTVQCNIEKPESPTWTTNFTLPTVNRIYDMQEILDKIDEPTLSIDSSGDVMFSYSSQLDTIRVNEELSSNAFSQTVFNTVGQVEIHPPDPAPATVNLSDYVMLSLDTIPPSSFSILNDLPPLDKFAWADISAGIVYVKVTNDFGLDLDTVIVEVIDLVSFRHIAVVEFPPPGIPAGVTDSVAVGLGGKTMSNLLRLQFHCHTPGASMLSLSDKSLTSTATFPENLTISAARAEIPSISKNFSETVEIPASQTIVSARIASGDLHLTIDNGSTLTARIDISLPDFHDNGTPLSFTRIMPPNRADMIDISLAGYTFEPSDLQAPQEIIINASAYIDSTAPSMVDIYDDDTLRAIAYLTDLQFETMTGIADSTEAVFSGVYADLEIPSGFDSAQLVNAELILEIESAVNFPGGFEINLHGDGGQLLQMSGAIPVGDIMNPSTSVFIDSSIANFMNPIPNNITFSGSAYFGDGVTVGTITEETYLVPTIHISSPFEFILDHTTFKGDTTSEEIDQDDIDIITDHLIQASFNSIITNHLPLGATIEIYLDSDPSRLNADQAQLVLGPFEIAAGEVGEGNTVDEAVTSEIVIPLDSLDIKILDNPVIYSTQSIRLNGNGIDPVKVVATDYIGLTGYIQVEYQFDGEF